MKKQLPETYIIPFAILKTTVENLQEKIKTFITKDEFAPVKSIAYGLVGLLAIAVVGAIMRFLLQ